MSAHGPIRVLHVLGSLNRGGVETWLLDLVHGLDRSRWQFDFCALGADEGRYAPLARRSGSRVFTCPVRPHRSTFIWRLWRQLRAGRYALVHSHVHQFSGIVLAAARAAGIRARISHSHNTADGCPNRWPRRLYRALGRPLIAGSQTAGLACSDEAAQALFGANWRDNPRISVLHYGLNGRPHPPRDDASDPSDLRHRLGVPPGAPVFGHVGRFHAQKNHDFLLDVAAAVRAYRPEARWLLVGDGPERARTEQRACALGLGGVTIFSGLRDDVPELLVGAMDAFVFPSLYEGLPLALLEAQQAGLRGVASSRISREVEAVRGAIRFLPLEAGPAAWAREALACLAQGRIPSAEARLELETRGFGLDHSLQSLLHVYRLALGLPRPYEAPAERPS